MAVPGAGGGARVSLGRRESSAEGRGDGRPSGNVLDAAESWATRRSQLLRQELLGQRPVFQELSLMKGISQKWN